MNAFMLWAKDKRSVLMSQGLTGATVSQILSDRWKSMSVEDRAQYYKDAEHLKTLHKIQHPEYKYKPKSPQSAQGSNRLPSSETIPATVTSQARSPPPSP